MCIKIKIIGFSGSGRVDGNTDILVQQALAGAAVGGVETKFFHLNSMNIKGCCGCDYCKSNYTCKINDDMQEIYKDIETSDAIVLGSPIYMMQLSAQTKLLIDRLYALRKSGLSHKIKPKRLLMIYVCRFPEPKVYNSYFKLINSLFNYLELFEITDCITVGGLNNKREIENNKNVMQMVKASGEKLVAEAIIQI